MLKRRSDIDVEIARLEKKLTNPRWKSGVLREMNESSIRQRIAILRGWKRNWVLWHIQMWVAKRLHKVANWIWYSCE